ncbi:MAG: hypothetical protein K2L12_07090 [Clostridia bacterium]|nr:hypothetical protein [Clostridia bacterium]
MLYEKKRIITHRSIWLILLLLGIIIPTIIAYAPPKDVEIIDDNGYIINYYESLNETNCEIEVIFNTNVDSGYITVAFYDDNDKLLSKEEKHFYGYGNTLSSTFFIDGKVDSYEILDYNNISVSNDAEFIAIQLFIYADIFIFSFFIASLLLSYKTYKYNDFDIIIYAGWYHHYLKVNGTKMDEHNTLISFTAIPLSCTLDDGTELNATITKSNRISLKINNQLYT